ncbi:hypothetical protein GCM10010123_39050 [Pilimelia anulata]|uniref:Prenyltransferase n=1 Tax=Pilimelia anulata TaxID=53371 RepID=A0A8J3FFK9_9ACTN|nr:hypothetical protein [Pilimelia anulata]GGK05388.1 hypothetical protein GCM10010123_39050 [Pilimelia anulata]
MNPRLAIAAGVDYLYRTAAGGRWSAFHLYPGVSDEWVTAYVGATLAEAAVPGAEPLVAAAVAGLAGRQRADGRYGFNPCAIGDGDSTVWALRLGAAAGEFPGDRAAAVAALAGHARPDGVATYAADEPIRTIIEAGPERSMKGWTSAHACVTAAAAGLAGSGRTAAGSAATGAGAVAPGGESAGREADGAAAIGARAAAALAAQQRGDGSWPAYWWADPAYTVAHAAEALAGTPAAARAATWAAARLTAAPERADLDPSGDPPAGPPAGGNGAAEPFGVALALRALVAGGGPEPAIRAAEAALCRQLRLDGSWPASAVLRVPDPDDPDPDTPGRTRWVPGGRKEGAVIVDRTAAFTTATVVAALARAAAR